MKRTTLFKKGLLILSVICLVSLCLLGGGSFYWFQHFQQNKQTVVIIPKGASLSHVVHILHQKGVVDCPLLCRLFLYSTGKWRDLKAGDFLIPPDISPLRLFASLKAGKVILHPLTVVEGETSAHVVQKLLADDRFQGPCIVPPEGSLLPETYHFRRGTERGKIIERAQRAMRLVVEAIWAKRPPTCSLRSMEELLILASIVEKETALEREKPLVAAVFLNRLAKGMPLQADPTVVYALTQGVHPLGRPLTRNDLQIESPYNTYRNMGLPPTAITNPSVSAMEAVLHPAPISCLYFVADGSGGHVFCVDLEEHQKNHAQWRKRRGSAQ